MALARIVAAGAGLLALAFPAGAVAGTVTLGPDTITYQAAQGSAGEAVSIGIDNGQAFVFSAAGVTGDCDANGPDRVDCPLVARFVVNLLGFDDSLSTDELSGPAAVEAHGGGGGDNLDGSANADSLFGDDGSDSLDGNAGADVVEGGIGGDTLSGGLGGDTIRGGDDDDSIDGGEDADVLDGGAGNEFFDDGPGDDTIAGGPGNDTWRAGTGRDSFAGGDGNDEAEYDARTTAVTITLDGQADDGESGEGDNADVEDASGGAGNDRIVGNAAGNTLIGNGGDDSIFAGAAQDRVEGNEGNDTIDTRDGDYDSVDCGTGNDVVFADLGDDTTGCETAPDSDGDGFMPPEDCAPLDPAVHPGAGEIYGNAVDEDCKDGPGYLRVISPISYSLATKLHPVRVRFKRLRVSELEPGDRVEVRCKGRGCPFRRRSVTSTADRRSVNVATDAQAPLPAPRRGGRDQDPARDPDRQGPALPHQAQRLDQEHRPLPRGRRHDAGRLLEGRDHGRAVAAVVAHRRQLGAGPLERHLGADES